MRSIHGTNLLCGFAFYVAVLTSGEAQAQPSSPSGSEPEVLNIWPGAAPGTTWTGAERKLGAGEPVYTDVTVPTVTVIRPRNGRATGAAMIVCPGGGFQALVFSSEGTKVAEWLAARGVTAFVLKYRVHFTGNTPQSGPRSQAQFDEQERALSPARQIAIADAIQAVHYLRANAARFGISADRIGMMGFSAGAMTTMGTVLNSAAADRPDLAASVYGSMEDKAPPADGPPVFVAAAANDPQVPPAKSIGIYTAWRSANLPVELHIYERGGHGFGMLKHQTTSDHWTDDFEVWLASHGWLAATAGSQRS
jgi:acetyl esterase/lipase